MRRLISLVLLLIVASGIALSLHGISFGADGAKRAGRAREDKVNFGRYYDNQALQQTGASNVVAAVVVSYRGFDTLGEVTVLFLAAMGLAAILHPQREHGPKGKVEPASLIVFTGCRFLIPLILLFGAYIFIHGHLTPGGGFQ